MNKPTSEQLQALRVRIAELCGLPLTKKVWPHRFTAHGYNYSELHESEERAKEVLQKYGGTLCDPIEEEAALPDYTEDLNAIHSAWLALSEEQREQFSIKLLGVACEFNGDFVCAEAWQRAVALDRTLSAEPIV